MYFTVPYDKILTKQERKTPLCRGSAEIQEMDTVKNFFEKLRNHFRPKAKSRRDRDSEDRLRQQAQANPGTRFNPVTNHYNLR